MSHGHQTLLKALNKLMTPLIRLLLRHGIAYDDFAEVARKTYVQVAEQEFPPDGRKQSLTNVALVTGIHRHEVKKLLQPAASDVPDSPQHNRAARVITGWLNDPDFSTNGQAKELSIDTEFKRLVSRFSGDITPRPVLDELLRVGAAEKTSDNTVKLLVQAYVPHASDTDMIQIFGDCVSDLIATTEHNLAASNATSQRLQLSAVHDNFPDEVLANLESVSRDRSMAFLQELNRFFETQDRDSNPNVQGTGRNRAGIGLYFFCNKVEGE